MRLRGPGPAVMIFAITSAIFLASPVSGLTDSRYSDIASTLTSTYGVFLGIRGVAGIGWAMFATVATTVMVDRGARRGRAISRLLMAETGGVLLGSIGGGWLYAGVARRAPSCSRRGA